MSGHTPGEWKVDSGETVAVRDDNGAMICMCHWLAKPHSGPRRKAEEVAANARLIAAAPALLEALEKLVSEYAPFDAPPQLYNEAVNDLWDEAKAALAQAQQEGGQ